MKLVHNFCQLYQNSYFLLQRQTFRAVIDPLGLVYHVVERKEIRKDNRDLHLVAHMNAKRHHNIRAQLVKLDAGQLCKKCFNLI